MPVDLRAQQAVNGLPLAAIYALLAAAYSLVYGLVGRINLAFGDLAAAGGYAAAFGAIFAAGSRRRDPRDRARARRRGGGLVGGRLEPLVFPPLHRRERPAGAGGERRPGPVPQEFLRLSQGARIRWVSPMLNEPFAVLRAGDFFVTPRRRSPCSSAGFALAAGLALLAIMRWTGFGRQWRAYADDPARRRIVRSRPARDLRPDLRSGQRVRRPLRLRDDDLLRRRRLWRVDRPRAQGADRRHSRRHRLYSRRFSRRLAIGAFEAAWSAFLPIDYRDVAVYSLLAITLVLRPGGLLGAGAAAPRR